MEEDFVYSNSLLFHCREKKKFIEREVQQNRSRHRARHKQKLPHIQTWIRIGEKGSGGGGGGGAGFNNVKREEKSNMKWGKVIIRQDGRQ